jgi:CO/xanthine dehydrogenase Mo-binding subunit
VYSREDVVRLGPKRAPIAATAVVRDGVVTIDGVVARGASPRIWPVPEGVELRATWREVDVPGPLVTNDARASGLAEQAVLVAGALGRDVDVVTPSGARASATVGVRDGLIERIGVRVDAGDPLDETVLRSYAIGAAHMALGWVCTESLAVDPDTGDVHDLTIRSFGVIRAKNVPAVDVEIVADDAPPRERSSDAVFAAVAAATWNALARAEGKRPDTFPARETRAARRLRT